MRHSDGATDDTAGVSRETLQDRLVKEFRLTGAATLAEGNTLLPAFDPMTFENDAHCVATMVTSWVVSASEESPGPEGLTIRLFPEIANVA
jgi:hypothetical protein